ncbi:hypothetical protein IAG41_16780 [Sphingomonas sp. JC676]|uniref:hypothetical protein n=1 Tax=Sphingomonas sp. JC676 TaxID=2768065 RepID=UPI001658123F|nr:hypothetical protein [Sphingomonas sp. JC676]MBC9034045.1 hypothetical protein [Sphingomonas sp. JC676]
MTIATSLLLLWMVLHLAGDTPVGRSMRRVLVDWPVAQLSRLTRGHVVLGLLFFLFGAALVWLLEGEAFRILGAATPELIGWASTFEIATIVDLFTATLLAASGIRLRSMVATMQSLVSRRGIRRARTRTRARLRRPAVSNDDEERPAIRLAA